MTPVPPDLRVFHLVLLGGATVELRYTWPAMAKAEDWLGGIPWTLWDLSRHTQLAAVIAAGMMHAEPGITPTSVMARLDPLRMAEYVRITDDALTFAHTGKTRLERLKEAEEQRKAKEANPPGEAQAASP